MANEEQLKILRQGVAAWNKWRKDHPRTHIVLDKADLHGMNLGWANLSGAYLGRAKLDNAYLGWANLHEADLSNANLGFTNLHDADISNARFSNAYLGRANLSDANLSRASFYNANLGQAILCGANLCKSNLAWANLNMADLSRANLHKADLFMADLAKTNLEDANLSGCRIHGVSAWGVKLKGSIQKDLIITDLDEPILTVDNLEVAQFIYLLLHNEKIRHIIDTITSKVVLILGRFSPERKIILDAIREELRKRDYVPVLFDFDKPDSRDSTETVTTLARMSRFIIADITDPKSIPLELQAIVPDLAVPVQPLLAEGSTEFSMFQDLRRKHHWVLPVYIYKDFEDLFCSISEKVIAPAEAKVLELRKM
jgi:uncharacterized protein YjbI with pentapeptide repeats